MADLLGKSKTVRSFISNRPSITVIRQFRATAYSVSTTSVGTYWTHCAMSASGPWHCLTHGAMKPQYSATVAGMK
mgnify:CR=1 FL=1